jgi:hypothetical protein
MAELLFIATIVFVAYVVFVVLGEKKDGSEPAKTEAAKPEPVEPQVQQPEKAAPPPVAVKTAAKPARAKTAAKPAAAAKAAPAKAAPVKEAPAQAPAPVSDSLKNPKTGEVAKVPNSYAFAKRWIKDALVEEGLLEKVYKNNELDDATTAKIQNALQQLKAMAKYQ